MNNETHEIHKVTYECKNCHKKLERMSNLPSPIETNEWFEILSVVSENTNIIDLNGIFCSKECVKESIKETIEQI